MAVTHAESLVYDYELLKHLWAFMSEFDHLLQHIQFARDAARLLRLTVVQGRLREDGSAYRKYLFVCSNELFSNYNLKTDFL